MYYVTGDTHGDQMLWANYLTPFLAKGDTILVAGDFGVGFFRGLFGAEDAFLDYLSEQEFTVLFCDGNHENHDYLESLPVSDWHGGKVHFLRPNVIHLMRGEIYDLDGKKLFVFGGGYSLDQSLRKPHVSWWPQEMPTEKEYDHARENLLRHGNRVDYILTHTCPCETVAYLNTMDLCMEKNCHQEAPLTFFLQEIQANVSYDRWFFGHFHVDRELWRGQYALLNEIRDLETGKSIRCRL